jgi:tetratricopeptide (TPR) repeat protein
LIFKASINLRVGWVARSRNATCSVSVYAFAYNNRGIARNTLDDNQSAITDFNQALKINPNFAEAYGGLGIAHFQLGDLQRAIANFNQALRINPNLAPFYVGRGIARFQLRDKQGVIADLQKAANLFLEQGKTDDYQNMLELIKKLQR